MADESVTLATLSGADLTEAQIAGMLNQIDEFILACIKDHSAEGTGKLSYSIDGKRMDRAAALRVAKELREHYDGLIRRMPAEEILLAREP